MLAPSIRKRKLGTTAMRLLEVTEAELEKLVGEAHEVFANTA